MKLLILGIFGLVFAPLAGGLISGVDRRLTAWFQSRFGPPILQPFYDVAKLLGKEKMIANTWQITCSWVYLVAAALSVMLLFMGQDLLLIFFIQAIGAVFLVMGALSVPSPYSQIGGQRELLQILTYEPVLVLVFVGVYLVTGSFKAGAAFAYPEPLLIKMPLLYLALTYALTIKLRKSPFDFSTSHHGHQELVKGMLTEFSGPYLALVEIGHWYEVIFILGLCSMFWATNLLGVIILLALTYLAEIIVDNITPRMTWRWMLSYVLTIGVGVSFVNLVWLYVS